MRRLSFTSAATMTALLGALILAAPATADCQPSSGFCQGQCQTDWDTPCDVCGTDGNDTLVGTAAGEVICGLGGDDYIDGGAGGFDSLWGGAGNDTLVESPGFDSLYGGAGDDTLDSAGARRRVRRRPAVA